MSTDRVWGRSLPETPGLYWHRNLKNAGGRAPIPERLMYVGYVNWTEDPAKGHGTRPTPYMPARLRAVRVEHPLITDSLTVQEWCGEWAANCEQPNGQESVTSPMLM